MADAPFRAAAMSKQAGRRMQEKTPAPMPQRRIVAVEVPEHLVDLRGVAVEILQPVLGGARVVIEVPPPCLFERDGLGELPYQTVAWHDADSKKMLRNPVGAVAGVKTIRRAAVTEDVDKENALRRHPGHNALQQLPPVRHML